MKNDDLPTILPDHVVQLVARDGWRQQARQDAELEKRLAAARAADAEFVEWKRRPRAAGVQAALPLD